MQALAVCHSWSCYLEALIGIIAFADLRQESIAKAHHIESQWSHEDAARRNAALLCSSSEDFLITWLAVMRLRCPVLLVAYGGQPSQIRRS